MADPESQTAFEDVGDLLVLMPVPRNDRALFQIHVRQHYPVAGDQFAIQHIRQCLFRYVVPTMMRYACLLHLFPPSLQITPEPFLTVGLSLRAIRLKIRPTNYRMSIVK